MDEILDALKTAVICLDDRLAIVTINTAAETLFAVSGRQLRGQDIARALPAMETLRERMRGVASENATLTLREMVVTGAHAAHCYVDLTISAWPGAGGSIRLVLEFQALDRQRLIARANEMRAQHAASREMIRGLAHEIKNPLGGLRGAAQLLEHQLDDPELREYTAVIQREADRLRTLVDDLLAPRKPPDKRTISIHEPLDHVAALLQANNHRHIQLLRDYDPSLPAIEADRDQLVQVFFNLVDNAVTALTAGGQITLKTRIERLVTIDKIQYRKALRVDVIDDGRGISEARLNHIFQPMVSSKAHGGGMGLALAQYLVQLHGGMINCSSRPGHTQFSVVLPLERCA
jgi:two-component system nitrogen regulation sensor histidine kinase GlnL